MSEATHLSQSDCVFCRIVSGQIPADIVYRTDEVIAFRDIEPVAPLHLLVIPVEHVARLTDAAASEGLLGRLLATCAALAQQHGLAEHGYRVVVNDGEHGGQVVQHLHFHLIGGRPLGGIG